MGVPIQKILDSLPKKRQEKIKAKADKYIQEYKTLAEFRRNLGITQVEMAKKQGVKQVNVSTLERRQDMLVSSLHKYVTALGGKLEIQIRMPNADLIMVESLSSPRKPVMRT